MIITEILKYTLPSVLLLLGMYLLVSRFLEEESNRLNIFFRQTIAKENQKLSLPLRFQAYERLVLLLERMHPDQLVPRVRQSGMTLRQLRDALVVDITTEYQYNLTQQIYVSSDIWKLTTQVKDQVIAMIYKIAEALPQTATAEDLANAIYKYTAETEEDKFPTLVGLKYLKNEVAHLY